MDDLCNRCLVIINATSCVRVKYRKDGLEFFEICEYPTDPGYLKRWVDGKGEQSGGDCRFEVDNTTNRFIPFSTWHGDPVCSWHLWVLAEAEMRGGYSAGTLRAR